jgi:hypothetical protein
VIEAVRFMGFLCMKSQETAQGRKSNAEDSASDFESSVLIHDFGHNWSNPDAESCSITSEPVDC